jgi:hypothetical protein
MLWNQREEVSSNFRPPTQMTEGQSLVSYS